MTAPTWHATDPTTATLLDLLADSGTPVPNPAEEWREYVTALRVCAQADDGRVSANRLRELVRGQVMPQRVGAFARRACLEGLIVADGWEVSDDTEGRNAGRPARCYRWIGDAS